MDALASYDDDIYAWSLQQGAALRRLAQTRRDLPNELDLNNVAEEIEDVGSSRLHRVESFLELLLRHLLKVASTPDARPARHWRNEIVLQAEAARSGFRNSMRQNILLEPLWRAAKARADADLDGYDDSLMADLPATCPYLLNELIADLFDVDAAVGRLRGLIKP